MTTPATTAIAFSPLQVSKWELGVSLILNFWQPLIDAVSCQWGGPDSPDKRDWLCGYIADLWGDAPDADADYVETALLQIMEDEFEVAVEDDSAYEVGRAIVILRKEVTDGNFATVDALHQRFLAKRGHTAAPPKVEEVDLAAGSSDDEDEEMEDAPPIVVTREERPPPEVDEDGFETVRRRRR